MRYLLLMLLLASTARGAELHLLDVDQLSMEYFKYQSGYRDPYMLNSDGTNMQMVDGAALNMDINLIRYGGIGVYWDNRFHMASDENKHVRHVGWEYEAGVSAWKFDVFKHHHSQHGLEYVSPIGAKFPVEDTYGVRIHFIGDK